MFIERIVKHAHDWPGNTYVWQTKNPNRFFRFGGQYPQNSIFGTTIETNRDIPNISKAPAPKERMEAMVKIQAIKFVTIEPVLDFDVDILAGWIAKINPEFLNLGADSKGHGLQEPTVEKILELTDKLKTYGIELREKHNLQRLKTEGGNCRG